MGIRQYFSGAIEACLSGVASMGKTKANRVAPMRLADDGSVGEVFRNIEATLITPALPASGIIAVNNIIAASNDPLSTPILFSGCGYDGAVFGGKLILPNVPPSQAYRLFLFNRGGQIGVFNNGVLSTVPFTGYVGSIDFSSLVSNSNTETIYDGFVLAPIAFNVNDGNLYGVLVNNNGGPVTIPVGTNIRIQLSVLSK